MPLQLSLATSVFTKCVSLSREDAGLMLLLAVQQEAHSGAKVLQLQVGEEAPLKFCLHCVPTGSTAAPEEDHSRLAQQPVNHLPHDDAVLTGEGLLSPEAEVQHVGSHAGTGSLQSYNNNDGMH